MCAHVCNHIWDEQFYRVSCNARTHTHTRWISWTTKYPIGSLLLFFFFTVWLWLKPLIIYCTIESRLVFDIDLVVHAWTRHIWDDDDYRVYRLYCTRIKEWDQSNANLYILLFTGWVCVFFVCFSSFNSSKHDWYRKFDKNMFVKAISSDDLSGTVKKMGISFMMSWNSNRVSHSIMIYVANTLNRVEKHKKMKNQLSAFNTYALLCWPQLLVGTMLHVRTSFPTTTTTTNSNDRLSVRCSNSNSSFKLITCEEYQMKISCAIINSIIF